MKQLLLTGLTALLWLSTSAQKQNVYYLKNNGQQVALKDSADFIRIIREPDSTSKHYVLIEYYMNGTQKRLGHTSTVEPLKLEEQVVDYFPSGKKKKVANYQNGRAKGSVYEYYPNGKIYRLVDYEETAADSAKEQLRKNSSIQMRVMKYFDSTGTALAENGNGRYKLYSDDFTEVDAEGLLKNGKKDGEWKGYRRGKDFYTEIFEEGKLISGVSYDSLGTKYTYTSGSDKLPRFKGGPKALVNFITHTYKVPLSVAKSYKGKVRIETGFIVEKDGRITNIVPKNPLLPKELNEEAIRTLQKSPLWEPGMQHGQPVRVAYTLPISISLQ